jgi:hypothetical protein
MEEYNDTRAVQQESCLWFNAFLQSLFRAKHKSKGVVAFIKRVLDRNVFDTRRKEFGMFIVRRVKCSPWPLNVGRRLS